MPRFFLALNLPFIAVFFFFVACLLSCPPAQGQIKATIVYRYKDNNGLAPYHRDHTLFVNNGVFQYVHHDETLNLENDKGWHLDVDRDYYDWFFDTGNNSVTELRTMENGTKLLASWSAGIPWTITDETDSIAGYRVQKAVTASDDSLAGRGPITQYGVTRDTSYGDLIAWFASDIPIPAGPKGFYGLPGLIVRIQYSKNRIEKTTLTSIRWDEAPDITIPTEGIPTPKDVITVSNIRCERWLDERKKAMKKAARTKKNSKRKKTHRNK